MLSYLFYLSAFKIDRGIPRNNIIYIPQRPYKTKNTKYISYLQVGEKTNIKIKIFSNYIV